MPLDAIDRRILTVLQQDGRMTNQALAERVGLSPSPCLRRVRLLEEAGVLRGYVAVIDQKAVDLPVSVFISEAGPAGLPGAGVLHRPAGRRALPEEKAAPPRRHCLDRIELRPGPGQAHQRAAHRLSLLPPASQPRAPDRWRTVMRFG